MANQGSRKGEFQGLKALHIGEQILGYLAPYTSSAALGGSVARHYNSILAGAPINVGDVDIVAVPKNNIIPEQYIEVFLSFSDVQESLGKKKARATITVQGIPVDLTLTTEHDYPTVLTRTIGSDRENKRLATLALNKGLQYTNRGLINKEGEVIAKGEHVYEALSIEYVQPENR